MTSKAIEDQLNKSKTLIEEWRGKSTTKYEATLKKLEAATDIDGVDGITDDLKSSYKELLADEQMSMITTHLKEFKDFRKKVNKVLEKALRIAERSSKSGRKQKGHAAAGQRHPFVVKVNDDLKKFLPINISPHDGTKGAKEAIAAASSLVVAGRPALLTGALGKLVEDMAGEAYIQSNKKWNKSYFSNSDESFVASVVSNAKMRRVLQASFDNALMKSKDFFTKAPPFPKEDKLLHDEIFGIQVYESLPSHLQVGLLPFALPEARVLIDGGELLLAINISSAVGNGILEKQEWLMQQTPAVITDLVRRSGWAVSIHKGDLLFVPSGYIVMSWPLPGESGSDAGRMRRFRINLGFSSTWVGGYGMRRA